MKNKFKRSFSVLAALALLLVSVAGVTPVSLAESIDQAYTDDSGHAYFNHILLILPRVRFFGKSLHNCSFCGIIDDT